MTFDQQHVPWVSQTFAIVPSPHTAVLLVTIRINDNFSANVTAKMALGRLGANERGSSSARECPWLIRGCA